MQQLEMSAMMRACGRLCLICGKPLDVGCEYAEMPMALIEQAPSRLRTWKPWVALPIYMELHWAHVTPKQRKR